MRIGRGMRKSRGAISRSENISAFEVLVTVGTTPYWSLDRPVFARESRRRRGGRAAPCARSVRRGSSSVRKIDFAFPSATLVERRNERRLTVHSVESEVESEVVSFRSLR